MVEMISGMLGATSLNRNLAMGQATGMPDLSVTSRKREERFFPLEMAVGSQKSAHFLGAPGKIKNCLITTEVTTTCLLHHAHQYLTRLFCAHLPLLGL